LEKQSDPSGNCLTRNHHKQSNDEDSNRNNRFGT